MACSKGICADYQFVLESRLIIVKKERVKSIILVFLITSSVFFAEQLWLSEKLWSGGYNFFIKGNNNTIIRSIAKNIKLLVNKEDTYVLSQEYLHYPHRIVVNYSGNRAVYLNSQASYMKFFSAVSKPFIELLKCEQEFRHTTIDKEEEWLALLKGRSLYIDFGVAYNTKLLGQLFGVRDTALFSHIPSIKEFILIPGDNISNDITFYLKDYKTGKVNKFLLEYDRKSLMDLLEEYAEYQTPRYTYSFEIGLDLDMTTNGNQANKVILAPDVLFPLEKQETMVIQSYNPIDFESDYTINKILDAFNYSPNTIRKYTEADNTIVYVENYSKLKISPDGLIEYNAVEPGKGLELVKDLSAQQASVPTLYESLILAMDFINEIETVKEDLYLTGNLLENQNRPGRYKFTFDYYYNGLPIIINLENKDIRHAVEVEVINGTLNTYRQYVRKYEYSDEVEINVSVTQVLDTIFTMEEIQDSPVIIENLFLTYMERGKGTMQYPEWGVK